MKKQIALHDEIETNLKAFLSKEKNKFPGKDTLRIDLHCHDKNSNIPDEQLGRMLGLPETWLEPESLINTLEEHKCTARWRKVLLIYHVHYTMIHIMNILTQHCWMYSIGCHSANPSYLERLRSSNSMQNIQHHQSRCWKHGCQKERN